MLKLAHKGLVIVLLPVAFEAAFLWHVQGLLRDIDKHIANETASSQKLLAMENFLGDSVEAMAAAINYRAFLDKKFYEQHDQIMRAMIGHGKELWTLVQDDPQERDQVEHWIRAQSMQTRLRRGLMRDTSEPNPRVSDLFGGEFMSKQLAEHVYGAHTRVSDSYGPMAYARMMNQRKQAAEDSAERNLAQTQKTLYEWLIGGAIISCLLTAATALMFHREVYARLKQVLSNIDRLLRRAPLQAPPGGSDEIAELDRAIYDTASSISQLEKFRADAAQMMAAKLNEPLSKIASGIAQIKTNGFENLTDRAADRLNIAQEQVQRLQLLLQDLMSLDKISEARLQLSMSSCNLRDIADSAREAVTALAEKRGIALAFDVVDQRVVCDQARLTQVVINLLSNAIKFSPDNSSIEVEGTVEGKFAAISVLDHGRGIDPSFQTKIFHRFEQAKEEDQSKGSGLGLAICRDLVEAHGGTMTFESEPGRTKFRVRFPLESAEIKPDALAPRTVPRRDGRLWRKGLVLLALPLAIQLSVVAALAFVVERAADQMSAARNARNEVFYFSDATTQIVMSYSLAMLYNATQNQGILGEFDRIVNVVNEDITKLHAIPGVSEASHKRVDELERFAKSSIANAVAITKAEPNVRLRDWLSRTHATAEFGQGIDQAMRNVRSAIEEKQRQEGNQVAMSDKSRRGILNLMLGGLLVSVLASILVAVAFTRNLCVRISRIVENSRRLLRGEPLMDPAPASVDEVSTVDVEFYAAAKHLRELDRFRQELLSVTSHELRTPLTSLLGNFDVLGTGMYGTPTEQGAKLLDDTRDECAGLVQSITKFLDEEKARATQLRPKELV